MELMLPVPGSGPCVSDFRCLVCPGAVFYFFIFRFCFLQKYIFIFEIYRNILRPPRCRAAGTWSPRCGAAKAFVQKLLRKYLRTGPWGPAARLQGDRPPWYAQSRAPSCARCSCSAALPSSLASYSKMDRYV